MKRVSVSATRATRARACVLLITLFGGIGAAWAAQSTVLGVFKTWIAQTYSAEGLTSCMMWSQPEQAQGDYKKRGDIYIFVSHRPNDAKRDEIRFEAGYDFAAGSGVRVTIGDQSYTLTTDGSTAWLASAEDGNQMVKAMRSGRSMVVKGVSTRGTETTDTYSLYGFTAAYKAISKACHG